jgi:uncharacterized protein YpiB (UPF0302 family)
MNKNCVEIFPAFFFKNQIVVKDIEKSFEIFLNMINVLSMYPMEHTNHL